MRNTIYNVDRNGCFDCDYAYGTNSEVCVTSLIKIVD